MATTAAVVGTVAAVASAGYSIYSGVTADDPQAQSGGWASGAGGQGFNPKDLFKLFEGPGVAQDILKGLDTGAILRYLTAPRNALQKSEKRLFEESGPLFHEVQNLLTGLRDPLGELLSTGFRTDLSPIIEGEKYRLATETGPGLAERYAGVLQGSGFDNALAQAGEDLGMYLGEQQVTADEAAAGRRLQGLQMAPSLFTAPLDLQLGYGEALGAAGDRWLARSPGARQLAALPGLVQAEGSQAFLLPGYQGGQGGGGGIPWMGGGNLASGANYAALGSSLGNNLLKLAQMYNQPSTYPSVNYSLPTDTTVNFAPSYLSGTQYQQPASASGWSLFSG